MDDLTRMLKLKSAIMEVFNMRPSTADKCIAILDDIKAIIDRETSIEQEDEK